VQYALLIYDDETVWARLSEEEQNRILGEYWALDEALKAASAHLSGEALHATATAKSVRKRDGETIVTDGPFAETKETLGGFYLIDVDSEAEALEWAARIPSAPLGTIEVRAVIVWNEDGTAVPLPEEALASGGGAA
jgi:hypothetical protein